VDIEAVACVHNLQYSSVQYSSYFLSARPVTLILVDPLLNTTIARQDIHFLAL